MFTFMDLSSYSWYNLGYARIYPSFSLTNYTVILLGGLTSPLLPALSSKACIDGVIMGLIC